MPKQDTEIKIDKDCELKEATTESEHITLEEEKIKKIETLEEEEAKLK
ncbi:hypothetical protein AAA799O18_00649 [Marine Group I thaumarchaeote SCGC AAA799-O18]|nr:hypothetical protein AAA799O18_00649 [Marine Group I thaumarchaeote SCGC AAA799-O18]